MISTNQMTYTEATEYLFTAAPLFQNIGAGAYKEGLANTKALDEFYGNPHRNYRTIHVAGTNGKGSVSHTLAATLQEAGYRVGLYTSPHLVDFRERIRVNGEMIPQERVIQFVEKDRAFFEPLYPSFFELATALAFKYFEEQHVDVAVIEVGLGGRLDCTNIIQPDLCVITNISKDHVQFLGDTLPKIASEKAGIIKSGIPVVIGETGGHDDVRRVFEQKAIEVGAPFCFADENNEVTYSAPTQDGGRTYDTTLLGKLEGELGGLCQEKNTATILSAIRQLRKLGYPIQDQHIRNAFRNVCKTTGLMGRWQTLASNPRVICDTGHNEDGIKYIVQHLAQTPHEELHIIIGMVNDKDVNTVLSMLPKDARYYFTQASVKRALEASKFAEKAKQHGLQGNTYDNVTEAYKAASLAASQNDLIFVGGSTFIVADMLKNMI